MATLAELAEDLVASVQVFAVQAKSTASTERLGVIDENLATIIECIQTVYRHAQ